MVGGLRHGMAPFGAQPQQGHASRYRRAASAGGPLGANKMGRAESEPGHRATESAASEPVQTPARLPPGKTAMRAHAVRLRPYPAARADKASRNVTRSLPQN